MSSTREQSKNYLAVHKIPQLFESLLSCLMIERPEDPVAFIEKRMSEIKQMGIENVNWETFVYPLHPYRDNIRLGLLRDGSKFDKERNQKELLGRESRQDSTTPYEQKGYAPEVFQLTEAS